MLNGASVAIDGGKFKALNTRDKNLTGGRSSGGACTLTVKTTHLKEKLAKLEEEMAKLAAYRSKFWPRLISRSH